MQCSNSQKPAQESFDNECCIANIPDIYGRYISEIYVGDICGRYLWEMYMGDIDGRYRWEIYMYGIYVWEI